IVSITNEGMEGKISFRESLEKRVELLCASNEHIEETIRILREKISKSFLRNKEFLEENAANIFIISNGFKEIINPIVEEFGISPENVYANSFTFDEEGNI